MFHSWFKKSGPHSLKSVFNRMNLTIVLLATGLAGTVITTLGISTLRIYAEDNLQLIARSTSYAVEAAVFFRDAEATQEGLSLIAHNERVAEARITTLDGQVLAYWQQPVDGAFGGFKRLLAATLQTPVSQPIESKGVVIGHLELQPSGEKLLGFLVWGSAGLLSCLLICILGTLYLSRKVQRMVSEPLEALGSVAYSALRERDFSDRLPSASIRELDELSQNFNELLDEMQAWHSHLQHENQMLSIKANHDTLTGLLNRESFEERLQFACRDALAHEYRFAVFFIDSDEFKQINDEKGHAAGDRVLQIIAQRIVSQVREYDVTARLGGDEFAVLISPLSKDSDSLHIADKIIAAMRHPITLESGVALETTLSIGISIFPEHGQTAEELLAHADAAMYEIKKNGKEGWHLAGST